MVRVGVIGLGDIARKAYLPVLAARDDVELALMTRDPARLAAVARQHPGATATTDLDELLAARPDVAFVHASTDAHAELVERCLTAGVDVLVDKPLAPSAAQARALVELAERLGRSLAVGFNRRHAPAYAALAALDRAVVLLQKHRPGPAEAPRRVVFDDFVHVVDTLRWLLPPGREDVAVDCDVRDGVLRTTTVRLAAGGVTAVGVMHRASGTTEEVLEVLGDGHRHRVVDLAATSAAVAGEPGVRDVRRDDWTPVHTTRGFTAMVDAVLTALREGRTLSARDALRTHEVCEEVVRVAER